MDSFHTVLRCIKRIGIDAMNGLFHCAQIMRKEVGLKCFVSLKSSSGRKNTFSCNSVGMEFSRRMCQMAVS